MPSSSAMVAPATWRAYKYSFTTDVLDRTAPVSAPQVTFTPSTGGSERLYVQAVDRAGNVSPVRLYRFSVNHTSAAARWLLDGSASATPQVGHLDAVGTNHLTLSTPSEWVNGPLADLGSNPADRALRFDATTDTATSVGPALNTSQSYTVSAFVKAESLTSAQTVVSQDGLTYAGFKLGIHPASACGAVGQACWAFWTDVADSAPGSAAYTRSNVPVVPGRWTHLTGVYDATAGTITLYVCDVEGTAEPALQQTTSFTATWTAGGSVQLGRARVFSGYGERFTGAIDDVRLTPAAQALPDIRQACQKLS
ncbi:LamG domain-containing protein [Salana multivorans]